MNISTLRNVLPFTSIVGQDQMKLALVLNAINPRIGGVLIRGEKGTAKSTGVRALAEILPEIDLISGCPFNCDPGDAAAMCDHCAETARNPEQAEIIRRQVKVIDLPLGVTEDRVVGTIDIEQAIKEGVKAIEPGILAAVNRGILYIDEINLLDDHIADILLDAAAMGVNVVERDGISLSHPARFILIGTMNPEEGELRPQLLDRFGLQVSVEGISDVRQRMAIVKVAEEFELDPERFSVGAKAEQDKLRMRIREAKALLPSVAISDELLELIVESCVGMGIKTHRAEIAVVRTAKTIAAFNNREDVTTSDIKEAMELALPHRMRRKPFEEPSLDNERLDEAISQSEENIRERREKEDSESRNSPTQSGSGEGGDGNEDEARSDSKPRSGDNTEQEETVFAVGESPDLSQVKPAFKRDRIKRRKLSGRRLQTLSAKNTGRSISSRLPTGTWDISIDATLRAAAPYQKSRMENGLHKGLAVTVRDSDLREKIRVGKVSTACVFVVDASGSMSAGRRMESAKGAVLSMLLDSYQHRDKVGMVAFKGSEADTLLPLCSSVDLALKQLEVLPTGGRTPLSAGLMQGMNNLMQEKKRNGDLIPMMVLITDGRANSAGKKTKDEIIAIAEEIRLCNIHTVVIDTEAQENSFINMQLGYCRDIAEHSGGRYYSMEELSAEGIGSVAAFERDNFLGTVR